MKISSMMGRATRSARKGFTLIELLISVVLVSIVLVATFTFMTSLSNVFHTQEMVVDTQANLRFGLDFLARDLRRAGYLASPSATHDPLVCPKPNFNVPIRAVSFSNGTGGGAIFGNDSLTGNTDIEPDEMVIIGSFEASDLFMLDGLTGGSAIINAQSAARVLGGGNSGENQAVFEGLFVSGRLVRVSDTDGSAQFGTINNASFNGGQPTLSIGGLIIRDGNLGCGLEGVSGQSYELAVLNIIKYSLERDPNIDTKTNLVRTELDTSGTALQIPGTTQRNIVPILEYAVDMQLMAFGDKEGGTVPKMEPNVEGNDDGGLAYVDLNPGNLNISQENRGSLWHHVRSIQVVLSARTSREDQTLTHVPRGVAVGPNQSRVYGPLTSFNIDQERNTAAHVVTMTTQVELSNLTFANVR